MRLVITCMGQLSEVIELHNESENINFTLALTKCAFLCFHRQSRRRSASPMWASVATSGAGRQCIARASTRLACAHPRLHNRPPTLRVVPHAPRPRAAREIGSVRRTARARCTAACSCGILGDYKACARPTFPLPISYTYCNPAYVDRYVTTMSSGYHSRY